MYHVVVNHSRALSKTLLICNDFHFNFNGTSVGFENASNQNKTHQRKSKAVDESAYGKKKKEKNNQNKINPMKKNELN